MVMVEERELLGVDEFEEEEALVGGREEEARVGEAGRDPRLKKRDAPEERVCRTAGAGGGGGGGGGGRAPVE